MSLFPGYSLDNPDQLHSLIIDMIAEKPDDLVRKEYLELFEKKIGGTELLDQIGELNVEISALESDRDEIQDQYNDLENEMNTLNEEIDDLRDERDGLKESQNVIQEEFDEYKKEHGNE